MFILGMLHWWYGAGWKQQFVRFGNRLASAYDYFSIDLLLRSLFAPFRQISAGRVQGSIQVRWRAFVDRLISRFIGAFMRIIIIMVGLVSLVAVVLAGIVIVVLWALVPLVPIIGVVLTMIGWLPWKI